MNTISIDDVDVVVGLTWQALLGTSSEGVEIKSICARHHSNLGVVVRTEDVTIVGVHTGGQTKLPSGAAWLSKAGDHGEVLVLIQPVSDQRSWLCAIRQSAPVPDYDIVIDNFSIEDKIDSLRKDASGLPVRVVSPGGFYPGSDEGSFHTLVAGIRPPAIGQIAGTNRKVMLAAAAVVTTVCAGLLGQSYLADKKKAETFKRLAMNKANAAAAEQAAIENWKREIQAKAEETVKSTVLQAPAIQSSVSSWLSAVAELPSNEMGWDLAEVACAEAECVAKWIRQKGSTVDIFNEAAATRGWEVRSIMGNDAYTVHRAEIIARSPQLSALPEEKQFRDHFTSQLQRVEVAGVTYTMNAAVPVKIDIPPPTTASGAKPVAPVIPWKIGEFSISGKYLYEPRDIHEYIDFDNSAIGKLVINRKSLTWSATGKYVVKGI